MKKISFLSVCGQLVRQGDEFLKNHPSAFHQRAPELLRTARLHELYDYRELVEASFRKGFTTEQNFKHGEFSDLPLTIARGKSCFIDVYFWRRNPTTIHNHHFTGAFQCLRGKNLDTEFRFKTLRKLTPFHSLGELTELRTREVKPGDVEAIALQDRFIHQNHHHGELTVNLCFRTPDVPGKNLANFLYSGLKFEKAQPSLLRARRLRDLCFIDELRPQELELNLSDAFDFLLNSFGSGHPRILKVQKYLSKKIIQETGVDLNKLWKAHERRLDQIQADYE